MNLGGERGSLLLDEAPGVSCYREDLSEAGLRPSTRAYEIDEDIFKKINRLAFQTYVPASKESRAGAGAGLTDND